MDRKFAVIAPISSSPGEFERLRAFAESLFFFEKNVGWLVVVDELEAPRDFEGLRGADRGVRIVRIPNPRNGQGIGYLGGLCAGILAALRWLAENATPAFVLKVDCDSLVIRPFFAKVMDALGSRPSAGLVGVRGRTCNRNDPTYGFERRVTSPLIIMRNRWAAMTASLNNGDSVPTQDSGGWERTRLQKFGKLEGLISQAERNGYATLDYCQGGAYVITNSMLGRLSRLDGADDPLLWIDMPVGEDVIMGMYAYATGMELLDLSRAGEPFGCHWRTLAFHPRALIDSGYSVIHSVKWESAATEQSVREYFRAARRGRE